MRKRKRFQHRNKNRSTNDNPIERLYEWQEDRYDPGYFIGGNIHPLISGPRPNKYGYLLIASGLMTVIIMVLALKAGQLPLYEVFVLTPLIVLVFVAGFKLIRKQNRNRVKKKGMQKGSNYQKAQSKPERKN